jgi:hypothetical protein
MPFFTLRNPKKTPPIPMQRPLSKAFAVIAALTGALSSLSAQDASPVDIAQLLQALKSLRETQANQIKSLKQKALQEVQAAASSGPAAAAAWQEAVRLTQIEGGTKEGAQLRAWKDQEGEALKEKESQNAARLFYAWLGITLQRSSGVSVKDLMPTILQYTRELTADQQAMEVFEERLKRDREVATTSKSSNAKEKTKDETAAKRMHDEILRKGLAGSPPVLAMKIAEHVRIQNWEGNPGNLDGIFEAIVLPELRNQRDPRLLEYWDGKIRRESEAVAKAKLAYETEKFLQVRRPELAWKRAQDVLVLGQRNKAIGDMFNVIRTYPTHPSAGEWIGKLEELIAPPSPGAAAGGAGGAEVPPAQ